MVALAQPPALPEMRFVDTSYTWGTSSFAADYGAVVAAFERAQQRLRAKEDMRALIRLRHPERRNLLPRVMQCVVRRLRSYQVRNGGLVGAYQDRQRECRHRRLRRLRER